MNRDGERWKDISRIFDAALARAGDERQAFVAAACGSDDALRREVESLLNCDSDANELLTTPPADVISQAMDVIAKTMATDARSLIGRQVGYYRIEARLGAGGMGEVYKATDTRLLRPVALKILPKHLRDPNLRRRFDQEAQAVAAVRHPHICVLHDIGQDGEIEFLVMEYLEGETLGERLARGPLTLDEVFRWATEIADALVATHQQRITHRDLKPGNVMLTSSGAKLLDFGLATLHSAMASPDPAPAKSDSTATPAAIVGTPPYMAPEQLQGKESDHRTDIFAFGALLYEMVTGQKAFDGQTRSALAAAILTSEPAPMADDIPSAARRLEPVIRRCLAKDPNQRWQSTGDMARELRRLAGRAFGGGAAVPASRAHRATRAALALVAVSVLAAAATWRTEIMDALLSRPKTLTSLDEAAVRKAPSTIARVAPFELRNMLPLTPDVEQLEVDPVISPNGRFVAYSAGHANRMQIRIREIAGGATRALTPGSSELQFQPRWSPDGNHILYITLSGAFVVPALGGNSRRLDSWKNDVADHSQSRNPGTRVFGAAWSSDSQRVAIAYGASIVIVPIDGGQSKRLSARSIDELHHCDWSPNDRWIACASGNWRFAGPLGNFGNIAPSAIVLIPVDGGPLIEVANRTHMNVSPAWSPNSTRLYFVSNRQNTPDIYSVEVSSDGRVRDDPVRVTNLNDVQSVAFSPDGARLAYTRYSAIGNIWSLPIPSGELFDISNASQITFGNQIVEAMTLSPDGKWLLYDSTYFGNADIFRIPIGGGIAQQLTRDPADDFAPDVSPDGNWLTYQSWRTGSRDVFVQPLSGGAADQVTRTGFHESYPVFFGDERSLIFYDQSVISGVPRGGYLVRRERSGEWGEPQHMGLPEGLITLLPNGSLALATLAGGIVIGTANQVILSTVYQPASNADPHVEYVRVPRDDGRTLYFKAHDAEGRASFWSVPALGGQPVRLVQFADPARPSTRADFEVGGGRFYFTVDERRSDIWLADVIER